MQAYGNNIIVVTYVVYLLISVALTIWVARTLYKRGAIFLVDVLWQLGAGRFGQPSAGGGLLPDQYRLCLARAEDGSNDPHVTGGDRIAERQGGHGAAHSRRDALLQPVRFLPHPQKLARGPAGRCHLRHRLGRTPCSTLPYLDNREHQQRVRIVKPMTARSGQNAETLRAL